MAITNLAMPYGQRGEIEWEDTSDVVTSRDTAIRNLKTEPFVPADYEPDSPHGIQRLYRTSKGRSHSLASASDDRGIADLAFSAIPTVAFSFAILGFIATALAIAEKKPAYLIPSILAVVGFSILGAVAGRLAALMKKAQI